MNFYTGDKVVITEDLKYDYYKIEKGTLAEVLSPVTAATSEKAYHGLIWVRTDVPPRSFWVPRDNLGLVLPAAEVQSFNVLVWPDDDEKNEALVPV